MPAIHCQSTGERIGPGPEPQGQFFVRERLA